VVLDSFTFVPVPATNTDPTLAAWRMTYFGTSGNVGAAADAADVDQDGIPNLFEYATGSYPTLTNGPLLAVSITNNHLAVTFNRARDASDVILRVEGADRLASLISDGTEIWNSGLEPYPGGLAPFVPVTVLDPYQITNVTRFLWIAVALAQPGAARPEL
jgi:hypothetical protein